MLNPQYNHRSLLGPGTIQNLVKMPPFLSPHPYEDGTYPRSTDNVSHVTVSAGQNPMAAVDLSHYYDHVFNNNGEIYLSANILDNLTLRSSVGARLRYVENERFAPGEANSNRLASGSEDRSRLINLLNENILTYQETFGVHEVTGLLGASFQHE